MISGGTKVPDDCRASRRQLEKRTEPGWDGATVTSHGWVNDRLGPAGRAAFPSSRVLRQAGRAAPPLRVLFPAGRAAPFSSTQPTGRTAPPSSAQPAGPLAPLPPSWLGSSSLLCPAGRAAPPSSAQPAGPLLPHPPSQPGSSPSPGQQGRSSFLRPAGRSLPPPPPSRVAAESRYDQQGHVLRSRVNVPPREECGAAGGGSARIRRTRRRQSANLWTRPEAVPSFPDRDRTMGSQCAERCRRRLVRLGIDASMVNLMRIPAQHFLKKNH